MAVLGDDKGNILARKMGKSLDFQHLGTARARQNLSRLVHSLPSWKTEGRLHAVAIAMQSQFLYEPDHFKDMVQTVVGAEDIKLRLHCFQEAAMQCVPGRKPDVVVLTDTVGAVLGRDKTGAISKLVTGGWCLEHRQCGRAASQGEAGRSGGAQGAEMLESLVVHSLPQPGASCRSLHHQAGGGRGLAGVGAPQQRSKRHR